MARARPKQLGRYEILLELGRGGMAELDLARLSGAGGFAKLVAIKRILPHLAEDKQFVELFLNEGRIAAQLSHPNVCQVHELGDEAGELYLAMEYLDGVSWHELALRIPFGDLTRLRLTAGVLAQAAEGLHYAHQLRDLHGNSTPVIHRDISPQNLFVTIDGVCKVLDFGVAKMMTEGPRTRTGVLKGKLPYMSPEQIRGEPIDPRADVFSLGVVAWESLTGDSLFDRDTDFLIWKAISEDPIPLATARRPELPAAVDHVLAKALARDRAYRHATVRELAAALVEIAGTPFTAPEIAATLRSECAAHLADRARAVAGAVGPAGPAPSDTILDSAAASTKSMMMRRDSVAVTRASPRRRLPAVLAVALVGAVGAVAIGIAIGKSSGSAVAKPDATIAMAAAAVAPPVVDAAVATPDAARAVVVAPKHKAAVVADPGMFTITSEPYATIFIDDRRIDVTPIVQLKLPAGDHRVHAVLADGRERTFAIHVVSDRELNGGKLAW